MPVNLYSYDGVKDKIGRHNTQQFKCFDRLSFLEFEIRNFKFGFWGNLENLFLAKDKKCFS